MNLTEPTRSTKQWERLRDDTTAKLKRLTKPMTAKERREAIERACFNAVADALAPDPRARKRHEIRRRGKKETRI